MTITSGFGQRLYISKENLAANSSSLWTEFSNRVLTKLLPHNIS